LNHYDSLFIAEGCVACAKFSPLIILKGCTTFSKFLTIPTPPSNSNAIDPKSPAALP
jgi:hypothetical protein